MEENSTFKAVTIVLGAVIGVVLLGIIGVSIYGALNANRLQTEMAVVDSAPTEADDAASAEEASTDEGDADGEEAVAADEDVASEEAATEEAATEDGEAESETAEDATAVDSIAEEVVAEEATDGSAADESATEEAATADDGAESDATVADDAEADSAATEDALDGDALDRDAVDEETVAEDTVAEDTAADDTVDATRAEEATDQTVAVVLPEPVPQAPSHVVDAFNKGGCAGCHMIPGIPGANGQIGPNLTTIGVDGATRIDGYSAEGYVTESILDPNAFIAPECPNGPCPANVMLQSFADTLNDDDLMTIVGYLATLGTENEAELAVVGQTPVILDSALPTESVLEPFAALPSDPADPAMIALGKHLFFDQRLSGNNSLSCATCHQPENAFTDGEAMSRGYPSTMLFRNTPTLFNTAYADYLYRDGRMDGNDLPTTVRDHIAEAHFMSMDGRLMVERINQVPAYVDLYNEAFGGEPSYGRTLNAIAAYVRTLNSSPTAYDLYVAGDESALSDEAIAGMELFQGKAGCADCHAGEMLTDEGFHNIGVGTDLSLFEEPERHLTFRRFFRTLGTPNYRALNEDVGRYALSLDEEDWGAFNTPSLREVSRTAPYMHDGSLSTLDEVVAFYNEGGGENGTAGLEPLNLSEEEIVQLVAFLESLSSDPVEVSVPDLPGYQVVPLGDHEMAAAAAAVETEAAVATEGAQSEESEVADAEEAVAEEVTSEVAEDADPAEEIVAEIEEAAAVIEEASAEIEEATEAIEEASADIEAATAEIEEATENAAAAAEDAEAAEEAPAEEAPAEEPAAEEAPAEEAAPEAAAAPEPVEVTPELIAAFTKGTCNACHVVPDIPGAVGVIGPDMTNIGEIGATRVEGLSAEEYIRQSIMEPMAYTVPDCPLGPCTPGVMPANIVDMISADELDMIVNYLASLGDGG